MTSELHISAIDFYFWHTANCDVLLLVLSKTPECSTETSCVRHKLTIVSYLVDAYLIFLVLFYITGVLFYMIVFIQIAIIG